MVGDSPTKEFLPGLSVVMMGRNEERYLPKTLPPLLAVADEVIFVDTGSQDRSKSIAGDLGCRVFTQPWQDNFSSPKNHAIEQAGFSWILNVDCDELLSEPATVKGWLDILAADDPAPAYLINIDNLLNDGSSYPMEALRFFRNDRRIRFLNPVHEGIADSIYHHWPNHPLPRSKINLLHFGYQAGINRDKIKRNIAILRKWVAEEPDNIYGVFKLGNNLCHQGMVSEGEFFLARAFGLLDQAPNKNTYPFASQLVGEYYKILIENGNSPRAEAVKQTIASW